jgi:hypothetical protein
MDKVQNPSNSECYTLSSELFKLKSTGRYCSHNIMSSWNAHRQSYQLLLIYWKTYLKYELKNSDSFVKKSKILIMCENEENIYCTQRFSNGVLLSKAQ